MPTLHWLTRDQDVGAAPRVPYRLLEEAPDLSAGDAGAENLLIQGDNLEALKALLPFFAGRVKCVYIDPPYNTRSAFEHYDDNLEHSRWLAMMWPRLELLRELLSEDGSIWVFIDDHEGHYLKVVMDEIFGRSNFVASVIWEKKFSPQNDAEYLSDNHDFIHVFARTKSAWTRNLLPMSEGRKSTYINPDDDPRGPWASADYTCAKTKHERPNLFYAIRQPSTGDEIWPSENRVWAFDQAATARNIREGRIWWGKKGGNSKPRLKKFLKDGTQRVVPKTVLSYEDVGTNQESKREVRTLKLPSDFATPKPERLLKRIMEVATNPGDLVLDSFLGSGTTAAVAHKMGRRWIGIEMGEHAVTHCAPRLRKVIDGEQGGISKSVGWQGGGGFRFCRLGPPAFDADGRLRPDIRYDVLAAHVWFSETGTAWRRDAPSPLLGVHGGEAVALLFNGVLGDRRPGGGNVLTHATLRLVRARIAESAPGFDGSLTVYGERSRLTPATLERERVAFRQTPYDVKARA